MKNNTLPQTQLVVGAPFVCEEFVLQQLQRIFCVRDAHRGCSCSACKQLALRQHHAVRWYAPEKQMYTVAQLESLFDTVRFALDADEQYVFVIDQADALSGSCANSLLKTLEEPPPGYHFILTTAYSALVLPTIYSRSVVHELQGSESSVQAQKFLSYFKHPQKSELYECLKEFDKIKVTESMSKQLLDELIRYWLAQYTHACSRTPSDAQRARNYLDILSAHVPLLPMQGSAKLFWKTLFASLVF